MSLPWGSNGIVACKIKKCVPVCSNYTVTINYEPAEVQIFPGDSKLFILKEMTMAELVNLKFVSRLHFIKFSYRK